LLDNKFQTSTTKYIKALSFLYAFEESADWPPLLSFHDDTKLHISKFKQLLSTCETSKEYVANF